MRSLSVRLLLIHCIFVLTVGGWHGLSACSLDKTNNLPPLSFDFDPSVPDRHRGPISAAMSTWATHLKTSAVLCPACEEPFVMRFRFVVGDHGDGFPLDSGAVKVAHVVSSKLDRHAPEIHFNASRFLAQDRQAPDIYPVALHEIGHALGLTHSADPTSIMFPNYQPGGLILDSELNPELIGKRLTPIGYISVKSQ